MAKTTPTQRALKDLRDLGFTADKVEQRLPKCFITRDALGFGDILAAYPGYGVALIQVTSGSNAAARRTKIHAEPRARVWLQSGGRIELWSYRKGGARGTRKAWKLTREEITLAELPADLREDPYCFPSYSEWTNSLNENLKALANLAVRPALSSEARHSAAERDGEGRMRS